ncbi:hypothetical protein OYC64_001609 [Pagothenia borchgrevinki]|uniref:Uncharacterized protein n=1 Tax=Pagothenia borchgrevinki TaxID=8213 RepID=A0ABD2GC86_PAGBO
MMDTRNEKSYSPNNDGAKNNDCNVNSHRGVAISDQTQGAVNNKTAKEAIKQLLSQVKPNQQGLFQPPSTQQPPLHFSLSQRKPSADAAVAVSGGMDIMSVTSGFVKNNTLKPHSERNGQSGFSCLGNWNGQHLETRPPQQPQPNRKPQPPPSSFLQPQIQTQPDPQPQTQLLPLESFLAKAQTLTSRETNGNVDIRRQNNLNAHPNPSTATNGPMEKLCTSIGEKSRTQTTNPLCGALGVPSQPHPSLGFTDTGQQGPSVAPDIHTVTLQLSKSQVEDVLPPVFSVTPKGSGAGYGVGFDLDDLLNQSLTDLQHCDSYDSAPLSASLLSDWSEVHRMTPADLESLQQELQLGSPMILSDTIPPDA